MPAVVRTSRDRLTRTEPFEVFTRPQRSWPARLLGLAIRLRAEITMTIAVLTAWAWLRDRITAWTAPAVAPESAAAAEQLRSASLVAGLVLLGLVLVVLAVPMTRRYVVRRCFAVITRHRFRAACIERRVMNFSGNVPLLLWCRPTPVGERLWVLLRAGIDAGDIERNLSHAASACWAGDARAAAHRKVSALVVVDVIRRDPLRGSSHTSPHSTRPARRQRLVVLRGGRSA
jgi:hypothetical protein